VWDITIPDAECFSLANGAVVHNSADAFRYAACVFNVTMQRERKDPGRRGLPPGSPLLIPEPPVQWRQPDSFSLEELFEAEENATRRMGKRRVQ